MRLHGTGSNMNATISFANGSVLTATTPDEFDQHLSDAPDQVLAARVEAGVGSERGVLIARRHLPGLVLHIEDDDRERALGRTETLFRQMMIGYVDRMGGTRGLAWIVSAIAPLLLVGIAVAPGDAPTAARTAVVVGALVAGVAIFGLAYDWLLDSNPFDLRRELPPPRAKRLGAMMKRLTRNPWTLRCLRVLGALTIGAAGSKLAEVLPFP